MKYLYVPWRSKYVTNNNDSKKENLEQQECIFCQKLYENQDEQNFIINKYKYNFIMLNLYPYNAGHLMILPIKHVKNLEDLTKSEKNELIELTSISCKIFQDIMKAEGINVGINFGKAAGAGIPSHLHIHVLPRWVGDTNFLPIIGQTKTISIDLNKIYKDLKSHFDKIKLD